MPVYEYHCAACQERFETLLRSMNSRQKVACPQCGSTSVTRLMSLFSTSQSSVGRASGSLPGPCTRCGDPTGPCAQEG